jgi:hypothetical protein
MILVYRVESNRASNRTIPMFDSIYRTEIPCSTRSNRTVLGSISHLWTYLKTDLKISVNQEGLITIAEECGLRHSDLWRATRRINLPEVLADPPAIFKGFCNPILIDVRRFVELSTVWTATRKEKAPRHDKGLAQRVWRTRQVGIFFAKVSDSSWLFIVLLAHLSATYDNRDWKEHEFNFCVRANFGDNLYEWVAKDMPIHDLIANIAINLDEKGPNYLSHILIDMLWGWERYFAQIRNDIRGVRE